MIDQNIIGKRVSYTPYLRGNRVAGPNEQQPPKSLGLVTKIENLGFAIGVTTMKGGLRSFFTTSNEDTRFKYAAPTCFDRV